MELEFDKEIDAILRKSRPAKSVPSEQEHIDADAIAAFVENALPDKTSRLYMEHFADCDRCRKQLSFAMQMDSEAIVSEQTAAPAVIETVTETIRWYQSIFRIRNLALTMGGLVLVFGGVLGFLVLQNQKGDSNATVSQVKRSEAQREAQSSRDDAEVIPTPTELPMISANAQSASNTAANTNSVIARDKAITDAEAAPMEMAGPATRPEPRSGQFQIDGASGSENNFILDGQDVAKQTNKQPAAAAAPAKPADQAQADSIGAKSAEQLPKGVDMRSVLKNAPTAGAATERDEKKEDAKDRSRAKSKSADGSMRRDAPPPPATSGPVQTNQANNVYQMSVIRTVSGKTFSNRDGGWFDSAYSGQSTTNVRRGTNEYKKLDSGLRNIADTLGGTVVVVWKSKAYRIQ